MNVETLDPPVFLVSMPQVGDPFFNRSVVLLLEHNAEGSFGLIINRPLELAVSDVIAELGIEWSGSVDERIYLGGPVQPEAGIALFAGTAIPSHSERVQEIGDGVHIANDTETLKALASVPPENLRLMIGYAGWGAGQLEQELTRNDWLLAPFAAALVFEPDPTVVWNRALESIGVRADALPSWTMPGNESGN